MLIHGSGLLRVSPLCYVDTGPLHFGTFEYRGPEGKGMVKAMRCVLQMTQTTWRGTRNLVQLGCEGFSRESGLMALENEKWPTSQAGCPPGTFGKSRQNCNR